MKRSRLKKQLSMDLLNSTLITIDQHKYKKLLSNLHTDSMYFPSQGWPKSPKDWLTMLPKFLTQNKYKSNFACGSLTGVFRKRELT